MKKTYILEIPIAKRQSEKDPIQLDLSNPEVKKILDECIILAITYNNLNEIRQGKKFLKPEETKDIKAEVIITPKDENKQVNDLKKIIKAEYIKIYENDAEIDTILHAETDLKLLKNKIEIEINKISEKDKNNGLG